VDNSGFLDVKEVFEVIRGLAERFGVPPPAEEEEATAFKEIDADDSGEVDEEEFGDLLKKMFSAMAGTLIDDGEGSSDDEDDDDE
jgi:Ca2+-binding EF-hand superfamily protein